jgi:hypothetical protein
VTAPAHLRGAHLSRRALEEHNKRNQSMPNVGNYTEMHMFYIIGIAIVILGGVLAYGMMRTGRLSRRERTQLEQNARFAQRRDDPQKSR